MKIEFPSMRRVILSLPDTNRVISLGVYPRVQPRRRWLTLPAFGIHSARRVRHFGPNDEKGLLDTIRFQRVTRVWAPFLVLAIGTNEEDHFILKSNPDLAYFRRNLRASHDL